MDKAEIIAALWRDLLEKDDRTSPAEASDTDNRKGVMPNEPDDAQIPGPYATSPGVTAGASAPEPSEDKRISELEALLQEDDTPVRITPEGKVVRIDGFSPSAAVRKKFSLTVDDLIAARAEGRSEGLREAAHVAKAHKGAAKRKRAENQGLKNSMRFASDEAKAEIWAEERGEDIAAEIIERSILALANQEPTP